MQARTAIRKDAVHKAHSRSINAAIYATFSLQIDYRLHKHIRPIEYDLLLHPNLETGQFKGIVKIALNISAPANEIRLHSHKLTITSIAVVGDSGHELKVNSDCS